MRTKPLTLGSLFDGAGGFPVAGLKYGIEPLWASEVAPFPIRVTTKRIPQMAHLGDLCKIDGASVPPVDIITGGFCCQDVSCSNGKRVGLHGKRSGLFFEMIRIIREMLEATNWEQPKFICIENVVGLLSSGDDFYTVLDELAALGFISDPNILASDEFSTAQRRNRVYIVSINRKFYNPDYFANLPNCRNKRMEKAVAAWGGETFCGITSRPHTPKGQTLSAILQHDADPKYNLTEKTCVGLLNRLAERGKVLPAPLQFALENGAGLAEHGCNGDFSPTAYGISPYKSNAMLSGNSTSGIYVAETSRTLDCSGNHPSAHQGGIAVVYLSDGYYTVRCLTPGEGALLQGWDAAYCDGLETPEPTEDEIAFWCGVWERYHLIENKTKNPKSRNQVVKWLQNPYSDKAALALWGNGLSLPVVEFVMEGIVSYSP